MTGGEISGAKAAKAIYISTGLLIEALAMIGFSITSVIAERKNSINSSCENTANNIDQTTSIPPENSQTNGNEETYHLF